MGKRTSKTPTADMFNQTDSNINTNTDTAAPAANAATTTTSTAAYEVVTTPVVTDKSYKKHINDITNALISVKKAFFKIAFALEWVDRTQAYEIDGYKSIVEFADKKFGIGKTSTYNYLNVATRFGKRDDNGDITAIADDYVGFSPTQLLKIYESDASDEDIKKLEISPMMTCARISMILKAQKDLADCITDSKNDVPEGAYIPSMTDDGADSTADKPVKPDSTDSPDGGADSTGNPTGAAGKPDRKYSKSNSLRIIESLEDFEKHKAEILDLITRTLKQDGLQCAVSINMEWD